MGAFSGIAMIGKVISHYKIFEKLGEGGMGVVYKAYDTKLDRLVALKFLPQQITVSAEDKARFLQEAKAISALNHPNIATIFDIDEVEGQKFLVLEYIPGGTLKSKLKYLKSEDKEFSIGEVLDYGIQAAEALAHAHRHQIIHRDVKTDNLMLTEEGKVKLTDFGLAKLRGSVQVTKTGATVGTAAYMSPEQIRAEEVDQQSDIFSLGVVLYELVTSHLPFRGEFETALSYSILNEDPPQVKLLRKDSPPALENIIARCLKKGKTQRYQTAEQVVGALREVQQQMSQATALQRKVLRVPLLVGGALLVVAVIVLAYLFWPERPITAAEKSIAVLPFDDMSPQKDQDWFCDGITDEIIGRLSNISELKVVARTSVFFFKGKKQDIREIGQKLGVATVLEGSIQKVQTRLRARVQLINVEDGFHLWSEEYDRELKDVFVVQDDIALSVAQKLKLTLLGDEKAEFAKSHAIDPIAYEAYLKGLYYWWRWSEGDYTNALRSFQKAIEIEPDYAPAHAGTALAYIFASTWNSSGVWSPQEGVPKGKVAAGRAIALDPMLADGYVAMGYARMNFDWDWQGAEKDFKRALELSPYSPLALDAYANFLLLARGQLDEAVAMLNRALALDPLSPALHSDLGVFYHMFGQFDRAIPCFRKTLELDTNFFWARLNLGWAHLFTGNTNEALAEFRNIVRIAPLSPYSQQALGYAYGLTGHRDEALEVLANLDQLAKTRYVPPSAKAYVYLGLGQKEVALDYLDKAYEERDTEMIFLKVDPPFTSLRNEPRFRALLKKLGLDK